MKTPRRTRRSATARKLPKGHAGAGRGAQRGHSPGGAASGGDPAGGGAQLRRARPAHRVAHRPQQRERRQRPGRGGAARPGCGPGCGRERDHQPACRWTMRSTRERHSRSWRVSCTRSNPASPPCTRRSSPEAFARRRRRDGTACRRSQSRRRRPDATEGTARILHGSTHRGRHPGVRVRRGAASSRRASARCRASRCCSSGTIPPPTSTRGASCAMRNRWSSRAARPAARVDVHGTVVRELGRLNADPTVGGIIVQMPLPPGIPLDGGHRGHRSAQGHRRDPSAERRECGARAIAAFVPSCAEAAVEIPKRYGYEPGGPARGGDRPLATWSASPPTCC